MKCIWFGTSKKFTFWGENAYKMFKTDKCEKTNGRDSSLGRNKLLLRWNFFLPRHLMFMCCFKVANFTSHIESPPKMQIFNFLFVPLMYQLYTKENIWNFNHIYLCQIPCRFGSRNRRKFLFAAASTCCRRKNVRKPVFGKQKLKGIVKWQRREGVSGINRTIMTSHTIADVF